MLDNQEGTGEQSESRHLMDGLPALVWIASPDGQIDYLNHRWLEFTGLSLGQALGSGWLDAIHVDDRPSLAEHWHSILASGQACDIEVRMRRFDGEHRWLLLSISPLRDALGQKVIQWYGVSTDIDEQKHIEEALRASERKLSLIIDTIPTLAWSCRPDGFADFHNQRYLDYTGLSAEGALGLDWHSAIHPDELSEVAEYWASAVAFGGPGEKEARLRRFDGVYRRFLFRSSPLRDESGHIVKWFGTATDIEDRKRAEEELRASERNLSVTISTIPALVWSARPDGSAEFFNQHFLEYVGLSTEEAQDWGWTAAVHPEDVDSLAGSWQSIMDSGKQGGTEARLRRFDGEYRWFLIRANPLWDESGNIAKWYGINTDIDDRKRAEGRLRRSEAFLAEAQNLSRIGSFSWRIATGEIVWSEQLYRVFEFDSGIPVTLERIGTRVHPEDLPLLRDMVERAQGAAGDLEYEHRLLMPDDTVKYLHLIAHQSRDKVGEVEYIGAVQDVTQRRYSDEALAKAQSELAHIARVMSLGELTASIAHEVNQPLSGIITNASTCLRMLAADPPNIDGARETARRTIRDGNRASEVVKRLRALFSKKNPTIEPVDLREAARDVVALLLSELQSNRVMLRVEVDDDLPLVAGDRVQLQQVILNLIRNASDAMRSVHDRPKEMFIRAEREGGDHVRLSVQDSGVGFDSQAAERLFEAFYTTKEDGMGIGLAVSRSIIETHHGRLNASPNDGHGATFSFSVPCVTKP